MLFPSNFLMFYFLTVAPSTPTPWPWLLKSPIQRCSTVLLEGTHPPATVFGENIELLGNITWQQLDLLKIKMSIEKGDLRDLRDFHVLPSLGFTKNGLKRKISSEQQMFRGKWLIKKIVIDHRKVNGNPWLQPRYQNRIPSLSTPHLQP